MTFGEGDSWVLPFDVELQLTVDVQVQDLKPFVYLDGSNLKK
jgi:hypothetical protein